MKKNKISIFGNKVVKVLTEEEAENNALNAIQDYLHIIKDDKSKLEDFRDLINDYFYSITKKEHKKK